MTNRHILGEFKKSKKLKYTLILSMVNKLIANVKKEIHRFLEKKFYNKINSTMSAKILKVQMKRIKA
jgi:hypothetical protein